MDETAYRQWWPLHLRVARGERLSSEEQGAYETGLKQLHQEESLNGNMEAVRQARAAVQALEVQQSQLARERATLDAEIALLEAALSEPAKQTLGLKG